MPADTINHFSKTIIIFAGDVAATQSFATASGLDLTQTILVPDPDQQMTHAYHADTCPRVFVADGSGVMRYTNDHSDDAPRKAPAQVIVSTAAGALRAIASSPISSPASPLISAPISDKGLAAAPFALTVLSADGVQSVRPDVGRYDFGQVNVLDQARIDHVFVLRNNNKQAVEIDRLSSSCGCTSAFLEKTPSVPKTPRANTETETAHILAPGDQIAVHVSVDASRLHSGQIYKQVSVYGRGNNHLPIATLAMTGKIQAPVTFSPAILNFGRIPAGTMSQKIVAVSVDTRWLKAGKMSLICSNPNVQITHVESAIGNDTNSTGVQAGFTVLNYAISLSPKAANEALDATISFGLLEEDKDGPAVRQGEATTKTARFTLPVIAYMVSK